MTTALLDGDMAAWYIAFGETNIEERVYMYVNRIKRAVGADRIIVCFGDPSRRYFRHFLYPQYKAGRSDHPMGYEEAVGWLKSDFISRHAPYIETDDVMGILATHPAIAGEKIVVSEDKDMLTVPCSYFNPRKPALGIRKISMKEADKSHLMQTLTGDQSDGYPGIPGIGPKKAEKILGDDPTWAKVVEAYKSKGLSEEDALVQARLARILRAENYDMEEKKVLLWEPELVEA